MTLTFRLAITSVLFLISSTHLIAAENCSSPNAPPSNNSECAVVGEWEFGLSVGVGVKTNPLVDGDDVPLIVLPSFSYYGEKFFINNLDIGYSLLESEQWSINLLTTPALDRIYFDRWDVGNFFVELSSASLGSDAQHPDWTVGSSEDRLAEVSSFDLQPRDISWMAGLESYYEFNNGHLVQLGLLKDILNTHQGSEVRFAWAFPLHQKGWSSTLGFTWKDSKMADYYYGLKENEITDDRGAYQATSSLNPFVRISWIEKGESESKWRFNLEYQKFGRGIAESPIIDVDNAISIFIGKQLSF